jgi:TolB protein
MSAFFMSATLPTGSDVKVERRVVAHRVVYTGLSALLLAFIAGCSAFAGSDRPVLSLLGPGERFAPGIASTQHSEIRLTISSDGRSALWFSRDRPGGPGGYDVWISRYRDGRWTDAVPAPFNSPQRDFDPALSADGSFVYFCSDRPGGMGGDDLYRVAMDGERFGVPEHLGAAVNSDGDEFAPMPAPDGGALLFSSDRAGGAGGHDLYLARLQGGVPMPAQRLAGAINTVAHEIDATFLSDGRTIVFARARDFDTARVELFAAAPGQGGYAAGTRSPPPANDASGDSYGAMLDWSQPDRLMFSARRNGSEGMDLYRVRYRLEHEKQRRSFGEATEAGSRDDGVQSTEAP